MTRTRTYPPSARLPKQAVIALLALGVALAGLGLWRLVESYETDATAGRGAVIARAAADAGPATQPFDGLTATVVTAGGTSMRVVVADADAERSEGLRKRRSLGPYDGMLFVYREPALVPFTMSTVPVPLDIAFYDGRGRVVTRVRMRPCAGTDSECPKYRAAAEFRYALETLAGDLPKGDLTG